ncbi:MAG TPA: EAL domain-containing protein [Sandaracinaceae bacterium LLY-WYZ-13_1]|nr:EAL domain-containing protein [Sandaracinaceae bacterium LLY-WYZ-13_1]
MQRFEARPLVERSEPRGSQPPASEPRLARLPVHDGQRRPRVLVIEDTPDVRRAVRRSLRSSGMDVDEAASGEEGMARVGTVLPDLVLTDVNMPGMDGFEVLEALRREPRTATIPVVLMTARDDRASVRRGMVLGADDYLTKPFTAQEIRETVHARLEHHSRLHRAFAQRLQKTQAALFQATHHDPETGLPNRTAFRSHLEAAELGPSPLAVMVLELDRFDRLQSAFHPMRPDLVEAVIREIAMRLERVVADEGQVFRLGPARFAVLYAGARDALGAEAIADCLLGEVRQPIGSDDLELRVTASAGVCMWSKDGDESPFAVAGHAEAAAFHARESGGNHADLYDPKQHDHAYNRLVLESSMHRALERQQFELFYQPQVTASSGQLVGVEALIRWRHPDLGMVSPFHFIPIAEETGLIVEIGRWVLEEACAQAVRWAPELPSLHVSVNLSALQLRQDTLVSTIQQILDESGLAPERLKLELTESMMVQAGEQAARALRHLRDHGVQISIDDFGTGYSSLMNLRSFPVGEVKIDRSFVRHVPEDRDNCSIVSAVIEMAHQLGLHVIAEGVEEDPQLEFLRQKGCDVIQGYYYSKPLPAAEFLAWARRFADAA